MEDVSLNKKPTLVINLLPAVLQAYEIDEQDMHSVQHIKLQHVFN